MRQMVLIYTNEATEAPAAERLWPGPGAQSAGIRGGETMISDGPFAETREQVGCYYIMNPQSGEEAAEWATKLPAASGASLEVCPGWEM